MAQLCKIPIVITPYAEGGFGVRSPLFPELITEGDTFEDALHNAQDAAAAVLELYEALERPLPTRPITEDPEHDAVNLDLY